MAAAAAPLPPDCQQVRVGRSARHVTRPTCRSHRPTSPPATPARPAERERLRVELVVDTEIICGRVYAVRIPDGHTVLDLQEPLRELQEATGVQLVVFADGATIAEIEIETEAVRLLRAETEWLRAELRAVTAARIQREAGR